MPEFSTNGIDKNELVRKIDKLEKYIKKAENRLLKHNKSLDIIIEKEFGSQETVVSKSLMKLKLMGKKRSLR